MQTECKLKQLIVDKSNLESEKATVDREYKLLSRKVALMEKESEK